MRLLSRRDALATSVAAWSLAGLAGRPARALAPPAEARTGAPRGEVRLIDSFGPVGGVDDTATFNAAAGSGEPFRLAPRSYRVAGPVRVHPTLFAMYGVPGASRILGDGLARGVWFALHSTGVIDIEGVIWDGDGKPTGDAPGMVQLTGQPSWCSLRGCGFLRGSRPAGLLVSLSPGRAPAANGDPAAEGGALAVLQQVEAAHNAGSGIWVEHADGLLASGLRLHDNRALGIRLNRFGTRAGEPVRATSLRDSFAWRNGNAGFAVGVYNQAPGGQAAILGPELPDARDIDLASLFAWENGGYGIAVQSQFVRLSGSRTWRNGPKGGIVVNARRCQIADCTVRDERAFGIDAGGSSEVDISRCRILDIEGTGINIGGGELITGSGNQILGCTGKAIHAAHVEFGGGQWLQYRARRLHLVDTTIDLARMQPRTAIVVGGGTQDVLLDGLELLDSGATPPRHDPLALVLALTDSIRIRRARFNGRDSFAVAPADGVLTVPDIAATVVLPAAPQTLTRVQSYSMAQVGADGIAWITVTEPGTGYTAAGTTATLRGDGDVAAVGKLQPQVWTGRGGGVIGIAVPRHGRGFRRAEVTIAGPGRGAAATVQVGLPLPHDRRLRLVFPGGGRLAGELPALSLGINGVVELMELNGRWIVAGHG